MQEGIVEARYKRAGEKDEKQEGGRRSSIVEMQKSEHVKQRRRHALVENGIAESVKTDLRQGKQQRWQETRERMPNQLARNQHDPKQIEPVSDNGFVQDDKRVYRQPEEVTQETQANRG